MFPLFHSAMCEKIDWEDKGRLEVGTEINDQVITVFPILVGQRGSGLAGQIPAPSVSVVVSLGKTLHLPCMRMVGQRARRRGLYGSLTSVRCGYNLAYHCRCMNVCS
ncbi:hypothetical protein ILYODFUR_027541 [Ilyodon furcidens]|uniref:Uncharacterized protein n=1 Tax=Ilyodon furcidens TaxID=33524 RepID=A0ABV0UVQ5_9TELE